MSQQSRSSPCPCGSGRKYKRCCGLAVVTRGGDRVAGSAAEFATAIGHFQAGRYRQADKISRRIMKRNPGYGPALEMCGLIALQQHAWSRARSLLEALLKNDPDNISAQCNLGLACLELGQPESALTHSLRARQLAPQNADTNNNLGRVYQALGQAEKALECYTKALQAAPGNPFLPVNAGAVCQQLGYAEQAMEYYRQSLKIDPGFADAHNNLGILLLDQGQYQEALLHFDQALQKQETADIHNHIGLTRMALQQLDQAREEFSRALELDPGHQDTLFNWAWFEEYHNNIELSNQVSERSGEQASGHVGLVVLKSVLARRKHDYVAALATLEQLDENNFTAVSEKILYLFEKGTVLDRLGRYPQAFSVFKKANETKNRLLDTDFDEVADVRQCSRLMKVFTADHAHKPWPTQVVSAAKTAGLQPAPLFIVGFPRSGTSLLTQMMTRHDKITAAGELPGILDLATGGCQQILDSSLAYPECLFDPVSPVTPAQLQQLREQYYVTRSQSLQVATSSTWVIDKMPHNALHLGLIWLLFPDSPIIHISRHPLDACLSAYFANFEQHRYTENLQSTARHYQRMMDLIAHYRQNVPLRLLEIRYQDLVTTPQATLQPILECIGLGWQTHCLTPEQNTVHVKTRSYAQVNEAIHTGSVNRYHHYRSHLHSVAPVVASTMQHYGYVFA